MSCLLKAGACADSIDRRSGYTALHKAADSNDIITCLSLITEGGADVNKAGFDGNTPLHLAVSQGYKDIVRLLLNCGADTSIENSAGDEEEEESGMTALDLAREQFDSESEVRGLLGAHVLLTYSSCNLNLIHTVGYLLQYDKQLHFEG